MSIFFGLPAAQLATVRGMIRGFRAPLHLRWACAGALLGPNSGCLDGLSGDDPSTDGGSETAVTEGTPDGAPQRRPCTDVFGPGVSEQYGRLDGILVAVVDTTTSNCRADSDHLHLQIDAGAGIIDVAVNLDALVVIKDQPPIDVFSTGWHLDTSLDYANTLGVHAEDFTAYSVAGLQKLVVDALAKANHVSVYATGYAGDGVHDVHKKKGFRDGAIVIRPTEAAAQFILFRFADQAF